ncbi:DNA-3-methyladenine glycosylase [Pedobacter heparinus]|uniref:Putative 3-methyladenine DNA glycosylase n=1 Tax=Pedobacter heparinus (strain ATCC 13125 / DSM 2366 / CIP 104194 / JCM 7457 / NBRC 12017 / NCIMB 9290 / NRRL B-14731 / HIM 762-3) TaxID=485917 RepID=C6XWV2_PEDHD|nr:DNA-3-methyladenine glycosylase [Pedobacter heparinus]ACU04246.1 DNA-3-methyladenine glycosylase [Pedobacter heparinus DSM 2366]
MAKLPFSFYQHEDVNALAVGLLGKQLFTLVDGELTAGTIVETEAYKGVIDKASHAYGGRFTPRTKVMYSSGGLSYVYLCYGIHHLFNVVTAPQGTPHAVLIRGLEPLIGIDVMLRRRNMEVVRPNLTAGPGALAKAMGIDKLLNEKDLLGDEIWIEDTGLKFNEETIAAVPRVGVDYAEEHALLPWRYYIKGNPYVSKPNR